MKFLLILFFFIKLQAESNLIDNNFTNIKDLSYMCNIGNSSSCVELAEIYFNLDNQSIHYKKAAKFYKKACDLNNIYGCYNLGVMYTYGCGIEGFQNQEMALKLYTKACKLGKKNNASCQLMRKLKRIIKDDTFNEDSASKVDCSKLSHKLGM